MSLRQRLQGPRAVEPVAEPEVERLICADQVRALYGQALPAMAISMAVALLVAAILREHTPGWLLGAWLTCILAMSAWRSVLVWRFHRAAPAGAGAADWERPFVHSLLGAALAWGLGGLAIIPADSPTHQAVVYFFLMGIASGSTAMYSAHQFGVATTAFAIMLPTTLWLFAQGNLLAVGMAFGGVLFLLVAFRSTRLFAYFLRRSFQLSHELAIAHAAAERLARIDVLTGLANRRAFFERGDALAAAAGEAAVLMLDIDHFKRINDGHGHAAGDAALQAVADLLRRRLGPPALVGRLGGEEFAAVLPDTGIDAAVARADALRREIAATTVDAAGIPLRISASIGVARLDRGLEHGLQAADTALYRAKAEGRDCVRVAC